MYTDAVKSMEVLITRKAVDSIRTHLPYTKSGIILRQVQLWYTVVYEFCKQITDRVTIGVCAS